MASPIRRLRHSLQARFPHFDRAVRFAAPRVKRAKSSAANVVARVTPGADPDPEPKPEPKVYPSSRAQRRIGLHYDELSRGVNPFSFIETCGVADATDSPEHIAGLLDQFGIVKVRGVYSPARSKQLNADCIDFTGLTPLDFRDVITKRKKWGKGGTPVLYDERFWDYVADPTIKGVVDSALGTNTFEFGTAIAAHYSARGLHRDYRNLVENDESPYSFKHPEKRIIRILHYCGSAGGSLGYVPFSHDNRMFETQSKRIGLKRSTEWFDRHREVLTQARLKRNFVEADEIERHICWAHADPGDIILSSSAILHCGEYLTGPRYFFVTTYAASDEDTLERAVNNATTEKSRAYYEFLLERGFEGSADVLRGIDLRAAT